MDLFDLREAIDKIDRQMVSLFLQRMEVAANIAAVKREKDLPIFVPEREQEKLNMVASQAVFPMDSYVRQLYEAIMALSRQYQQAQGKIKCGLLGRHLSHSYSPQIHSTLGDYPYDIYEKEPEQLENFLKNGDFTGLNVTIPYKKTVMEYCDELSPVARALGAVNTLCRKNDGSLIGHNTDFFGFETLLKSTNLDISGKKALVLGSGGASNTVCSVLQKHGAQVVVISRSGDNNYNNLHLHSDAALIVNTTPVGMYPETGISPVELSHFPHLQCVLDLIYNPARTQLLLDAQSRGIVAKNGLLMLVAQAWESARWFTGRQIPVFAIEQIYHSLSSQMQNIALVGMPGCGKTTVGKLLAQKTGRKFVDADTLIIEKAGMTIPELFAMHGESTFRALETQVLSELGKQSGLVIATGGGCVTKRENYPLLHQNGRIFWLQRDIAALPTDGRPLSQSTDLLQMYQTRKPLYAQFSDHCVENTTVDDAAAAIQKILEARQ